MSDVPAWRPDLALPAGHRGGRRRQGPDSEPADGGGLQPGLQGLRQQQLSRGPVHAGPRGGRCGRQMNPAPVRSVPAHRSEGHGSASQMLRYTVRRLLQLVLVLLVLSLLLFVWLRSLPGGTGHARCCGERCTPQQRADLDHALGLDQPLIVQYLKFLGQRLPRQLRHLDGGLARHPGHRGLRRPVPGHRRADRRRDDLRGRSAAIPLGYVAAKRKGGVARQRQRDRLAGRRRGSGVLPGLPAQVHLRREAGLAAAVRPAGPAASTRPG